MRIDIFIKWELQVIRYSVQSLLPFVEDQTEELQKNELVGFLPDGLMSEGSVAEGVKSLVLNSVYYELNALIEFILLSLVIGRSPPDKRGTPSAMKCHRAILQRAIESYFELSFSALPGFDDIEKLKDDVNALKHRGGIIPMVDSNFKIPTYLGVKSKEDAVKYINSTESFLEALWAQVEPQLSDIPDINDEERPTSR